MMAPPVAALEIGTTKVVALVGERRDDGSIVITGFGEHPSAGVRKGEIINFENAVVCARAALKDAEESSGVSIERVHLAISGGHIDSLVTQGAVPVASPGGMVTEDDIDDVAEVARAVSLAPDRAPIHTINQHFCVDDQERVIRPEGMEGARLSLEMLVLHGVRSRINNAARVAEKIPVDVEDVAFSGLCSALSVLTPEQKKTGVIVIDLGGGTTDYMAYADGIVAQGGSLGLGGDHITNDIALAFNISMKQAEELKKTSGSALVVEGGDPAKVSLPAEVGFPGKSIVLRSLHTVIHARVHEILTLVKRRLEEDDVLAHIGTGVVLTGGGTHMPGAKEVTESVFGVPCIVGVPLQTGGIIAGADGPEFAACCGLVQYGFRTQEDNSPGGPSVIGRFVKTLFGS